MTCKELVNKLSFFLVAFTGSIGLTASNTHFWNTQKKVSAPSANYQEVSFDEFVAEKNSQVIRTKPKTIVSPKTREMKFQYGFSNSTLNMVGENIQSTFNSIGLSYHQELQPNVGYGAGYKLFLPKTVKGIEFSIHQFQGTFFVNNPLQPKLNLRLEGGIAPRLVGARNNDSKSDQMIFHGLASASLLYASNENVVFGLSPEIRLPILSEKVERTSYDLNLVVGAQF